MMMRKRNMLSLPLVAAMVALMAVSAFAVAPIIDDLPRVVIDGSGSFANAVNLDAYIDWYPITTTEPFGANRDYTGVPSKDATYIGKSRFHVFLYDPNAGGRTLTNGINAAADTNLLAADTGTPWAGPLPPVAAEKYGVDPYTGPTLMSIAYSPAAAFTNTVDVFAVVEGAVNGDEIVAGYAPMTVVTGGAANQTGYAIQFVTGRANDSFFYWIPRVRNVPVAGYVGIAPLGRDMVDLTWADVALRNNDAIVGWNNDGTPAAGMVGVGVFTAAGRGATAAYANFIPNKGGGVAQPVFCAKARLVSAAAAAADAPGYRVGFLNGGYTHSGTLQVLTDAPNKPFGYQGSGAGQRDNGTDYIARCYWTTPAGMTDMADGSRIAMFGIGQVAAADPVGTDHVYIGADGRDYGIEIMDIDMPTSVGDFIVDALSVTTLANADLLTTTSTTKEWNQAAATLSASTWQTGFLAIAGINNGTGKIESNALLLWGGLDLRLGGFDPAAGSFRLVKANPIVTTPAQSLAAQANKLYRTTITVASRGRADDGNTLYSPVMQWHWMTLANTGIGSLAHGADIGWYESWGPLTGSPLKHPDAITFPRPAGATSPGVPLATPTNVMGFVWTGNMPAGAFTLVPEVYVYNQGYFYPTAWTDATGFLKFTGIKMEEISNVD